MSVLFACNLLIGYVLHPDHLIHKNDPKCLMSDQHLGFF